MFSQNNEEQIIAEYFNRPGDLAFLDIGANDGVTLSNTWALQCKGWNGTLVEPSPGAYRRLETNYLGLPHTLIQAAVTDFNGEITLHQSGEHLGKGDISLLSTIITEEKKRWVKESWTDIKVPAINFGTLLGISKVKQFDLISIDVEGAELTILKQMDLKTLGCKMLIAEFNGQRQDEFNAIVLPQGYKLIHKNGENLIYTVNG